MCLRTLESCGFPETWEGIGHFRRYPLPACAGKPMPSHWAFEPLRIAFEPLLASVPLSVDL